MKSQKRRSPKGRKLKRRNPGKREGGQKKSRKTKTAAKVRMRWLHFLFSTAFNCCLLAVTVEVRLLKNFRGVETCSFLWVPMSFSEFLCWPLRNCFPQEELYSKDVPVDQLSTRFYQLLSESSIFTQTLKISFLQRYRFQSGQHSILGESDGAIVCEYSGMRTHGIGGNCVLLGPILIPEWME